MTLAHGAGGKASAALLDAVFLPAFAQEDQEGRRPTQTDAALVDLPSGERLAFSTDSYVVKPLRFPGGSAGHLAVHGTINDLAMMGAHPIAISAAFVLEEGMAIDVLREVVADMAEAADIAGVPVVTGDTKVVDRGAADGMYITTAGVGVVPSGRDLAAARVAVGDVVLVSGTMGDHGTAVMLARGDLALEADIASDTAPLHGLVEDLLAAAPDTRWLRDSTRGGVGTVCNELARDAELTVVLDEESLPILPAVAAACELLGIDPLYVANEGKLVAVVPPDQADAGSWRAAREPVWFGCGASRRDPRRAARDRGPADLHGRDPHRRHARRRPIATDLLRDRSLLLIGRSIMRCSPRGRGEQPGSVQLDEIDLRTSKVVFRRNGGGEKPAASHRRRGGDRRIPEMPLASGQRSVAADGRLSGIAGQHVSRRPRNLAFHAQAASEDHCNRAACWPSDQDGSSAR